MLSTFCVIKLLQEKITYCIPSDLATHRETSAAICLSSLIHEIAPGDRHVIQNPVVLVVQSHAHLQKVQFLHILWIWCFVFSWTYWLAVCILKEIYFVWAWSNSFTKYHLAEILDGRLCLIGKTEIEVVVFKGYDWLFCVQSVYIQRNFIL